VAGYTSGQFVIGRGSEAESVTGLYVTGNWFDVLGLRAGLGRMIEPSDDVLPGGRPVAVLSHRLWLRRFGGDRGVIGTTIPLGGHVAEVIGVAPEGFAGIETVSVEPELFVPITTVPTRPGRTLLDQWGSSWIQVVGRLAPGTTFDAARAAMPVVWNRLRAAWPEHEDIEVLLAPGVGLDPEARAQANTISLLLLGIAALVLLLTCAAASSSAFRRRTPPRRSPPPSCSSLPPPSPRGCRRAEREDSTRSHRSVNEAGDDPDAPFDAVRVYQPTRV
jgi:hypothetical protein